MIKYQKMKKQIARTIEIFKATKLKTLIPKIRSSKFKNKNYSIIALKGFPGVWHHQDLLDWANENKLDLSIIDFGLQVRTVNYYSKKLKKIINKNFKNKKVILLGFSMGGLIATKFAQKNNWENIEKIITFASPFKGSPVAKDYYLLPSAIDMTPGSHLLKNIYKRVPKNKVICITAKKDELVDNKKNFLPGSRHIILPIENHANAQVVKNIKNVLDKELLKYKV